MTLSKRTKHIKNLIFLKEVEKDLNVKTITLSKYIKHMQNLLKVEGELDIKTIGLNNDVHHNPKLPIVKYLVTSSKFPDTIFESDILPVSRYDKIKKVIDVGYVM